MNKNFGSFFSHTIRVCLSVKYVPRPHLCKGHHVPCTINCSCCDIKRKLKIQDIMIPIQNQIVNLPFKVQTLSQMSAVSWTAMTSSPPMSARAAILLSKIQQKEIKTACRLLIVKYSKVFLIVPSVCQYQSEKRVTANQS